MATGRDCERVDVAIVGGGIAGLTVAYDLRKSGCHTLLLEAQDRVGGLIQTTETDGLILEGGPDALMTQKPAGLGLCRELGLEAEIVPTKAPRTAFVLRGGILHPLPADTYLGLPLTTAALEGLTMLPPEGRARVARDLTHPQPPSIDADESVGACLRRRFGADFVAAVAQPLLGGIHAGDVDKLSLRALFPDLAKLDASGGSLLAACRAGTGRRDPDGVFRGLAGGMRQLTEALRRTLPTSAVRTGTRAVAISSGEGFDIEMADGTRIATDRVVLATPAWASASLLAGLDDALSDACGAIAYASSAVVSLAYRRADVGHSLAGTGFVVPRHEPTRLLAVSFVTSKWPGRAPDDVVLLRAFAGGTLDEDVLEMDDRSLAEGVHRDLEALLRLKRPPIHTRVARCHKAGPQYEVGHLSRVAAIESAAERWPGLFLTGSAYHGVGIPDTIAAARRTATKLLADARK
jgi:oxygen-dependent protoporphyrinogen oxidase